MFAIAGASLDEVWGNSKPLKPSARSRSVRPQRAASAPKPTKVYDDIMEAYLDDFNSTCDQPSSKQHVPRNVGVLPESDFYEVSPYFNEKRSRKATGYAPCKDEVEPLTSSEFANDALEYQRFFKGDHMFQARNEVVPEENDGSTMRGEVDEEVMHAMGGNLVVEVEEEQMRRNRGYTQQEAYNHMYDVQRQYDDEPQLGSGQYVELGMYIFSGIVLIFLLEQILHLGLYLR